jgi:hypothetical protein
LPLIFPVAAYLLLLRVAQLRGLNWRVGILSAATFWGTYLAASTELLSLDHQLTRVNVSIAWSLLCVACLIYLRLVRPSPPQEPQLSFVAHARGIASQFDGLELALLCGVGGIVAVVAAIAILCPPNSGDVMTYHMPRVVMWMNNRGVQFFPTFDYAQLIFSPWSEYAMLHLDLLWGGDRFVNFVEWFSFVGTLVGVSLIAGALGAGRRGQVIAVVVCATIPTGILEASGAMNTYVLTFWVVTSVYFLLRWIDEPTWSSTFGAGAAMALAILTKGSAFIFLPCLFAACWLMASPPLRRSFLLRVPVLVLLILALNTPQFVRNYHLTRTPLGLPFPEAGPNLEWGNERVSISGTISNVIRNAALHLGTPSDRVNAWTYWVIVRTIRMLGADPNDPATTWWEGGFQINKTSRSEMLAGNPLQFGLAVVVLFLLFVRARKTPARLLLYACGLIGAFVLFCALLHWQPFGARHHLPIFALASSLIGVEMERWSSRLVASTICLVLLAGAFPFLLLCRTRRFLPFDSGSILRASREQLYFADGRQSSMADFVSAADAATTQGCRNIAIDSLLDGYVYPMMALLDSTVSRMRISYAHVQNRTAAFAWHGNQSSPCAVICLGCAGVEEKLNEYAWPGASRTVLGDAVVFAGSKTLSESPPPLASQARDLPVPVLLTEIEAEFEMINSLSLGPLYSTWSRCSTQASEEHRELVVRLDGLSHIHTRSRLLWSYTQYIRQRAALNNISGEEYRTLLILKQALQKWKAQILLGMDELNMQMSHCTSLSPETGER